VTIVAIGEVGMKRMVLVGAVLIVLAGCGGSPAPVGENSADSITTTAVGNVVAAVPSPTPTPSETATPDNMAATDDAATANDAAAPDGAVDQSPHAE
jgi:hypothetical protein